MSFFRELYSLNSTVFVLPNQGFLMCSFYPFSVFSEKSPPKLLGKFIWVRIGSDCMWIKLMMIMTIMMPGTCAGEPSSPTSTSWLRPTAWTRDRRLRTSSSGLVTWSVLSLDTKWLSRCTQQEWTRDWGPCVQDWCALHLGYGRGFRLECVWWPRRRGGCQDDVVTIF